MPSEPRTTGVPDPETPGMGETPLLYRDLAGWFHLLTAPEDYEGESKVVLELLRDAVSEPLQTMLELGSGGGNTASHLKRNLRLTLSDVSAAMIEESARLNPECEHVVGDMRTLRLARTFDSVLVHDAISYLTTEADLRAAFETAWLHLRPGGAAVFMPDDVRERFQPSTDHGGHDEPGPGGRSLRYLEWTLDPDPADTEYVSEFAYLLRDAGTDPDRPVRVVHDRHVMGLFGRDEWLRWLTETGFRARSLVDEWDREVFVAIRPG
jgi:trans-aconitate methyltransferase